MEVLLIINLLQSEIISIQQSETVLCILNGQNFKIVIAHIYSKTTCT